MSGRIQQLRSLLAWAGVITIAAVMAQTALDPATVWSTAVRSAAIDAPTATLVERLIHGASAQSIARGSGVSPRSIVTITQPATNPQTIADAAAAALDRLGVWLGPLTGDQLVVVDVPAHANLAGASYRGVAITSAPWLTTRREFAAERAATVAIARQYALTLAAGPAHESWFAEGLATYLATRAVHETFEGRYFLTLRYFGGYVPHSLRAILMSPNPLDPRPRVLDLPEVLAPDAAPWRLARGAELERARRLTLTLHTLERFIGWPALQATLSEFVGRYRGATPSLEDFVAILSDNRGDDMRWLFDQAMRLERRFDYAVTNLTSSAASGRWHTTVDVRRLGDAVFAGTSGEQHAAPARSLSVVVRFSDGNEVTEWIDGRDQEWTFEYASASPAVLASVDPGAVLLLDADRTNNTRTLDAPTSDLGVRLTFNWISWLQDAMLACTAVI